MSSILSAVITLLLAQSPDRPGIPQFRTLQYTMETTGGSELSINPTRTATVSLAYPDKARVETEVSNRKITIISDGVWTWAYDIQKNMFGKTAGVFGASADASQLELLPNGASDSLALASPAPPGTSKPAGEDTIEVGGRKRRCSVTNVTLNNGTARFCTDNETGLTVQLTSTLTLPGQGNKLNRITLNTRMTSLALNEPIAESLFTFRPPAGAKETTFDAIVPVQRGPPLHVFDLKALDGVSYNLSSLKGKSILLVFWTTWCRPCRDAAAVVNAVRRDTQDDGLVILGVDPVEPAATVEEFLKTSPASYPIVAGVDNGVIREFHISGYPTYVVLNGDGKVSAQTFGYTGETNLRNLLATTGPKQLAPIPTGAVYPGGDVSAPTIAKRVDPQYTDMARNARLQGTIILQTVVLEDGSVTVTRIVRGLGMGLDENAIAALTQWKFKPGMKEGKPVKVLINIEVNFNLSTPAGGK